MAKNTETKAPAQDTVPASEPLTLEEFCTRLSRNDRRVEMIGAFYSVEKLAMRHKDTEEAYLARYDAFINAPV